MVGFCSFFWITGANWTGWLASYIAVAFFFAYVFATFVCVHVGVTIYWGEGFPFLFLSFIYLEAQVKTECTARVREGEIYYSQGREEGKRGDPFIHSSIHSLIHSFIKLAITLGGVDKAHSFFSFFSLPRFVFWWVGSWVLMVF